MKNRDWKEMQKFYDDNHTWKDITEHYKIANKTLQKAIKDGFIKMRTKSDANKLGNIKKPRKLTEETKKKISESRKRYLKENPDRVPYLLNHFSKGESYPERYFNIILKKYDLNYQRYLQISYYNLDFAFVNEGIDLEIDGDQHFLDQKIADSNKNRDIFLEENGWKVIRILWSDYKRMKIDEREIFIKDLIEYIKGNKDNLPKIVDNKNYCTCGKEIEKRSKLCNKCEILRRKKLKI